MKTIRLTQDARDFFASKGLIFQPGPIPFDVVRTLIAECAEREKKRI